LGPVRHRSAKAQIHLTVIRARAELVSARTGLVNAARGLAKSYGERLRKFGTEQVSQPCQCPRIVSIIFSIALADQFHLLRVRHEHPAFFSCSVSPAKSVACEFRFSALGVYPNRVTVLSM